MLNQSYKTLIENLWPSNSEYIDSNNNHKNNNNAYYSPYEFKEKIENMFSLFNAIYENDPKCLVDFIVGKLHKELNKANNNNLLNKSESKIDKTNKKEVYDDFINYFEHSNQSIIIDLFYGINSFQSQCLGCQKKFYGKNSFLFHISFRSGKTI